MTFGGKALAALLGAHVGAIGVDLGCGDARATARWAAAEPDTLVVGIDANLDAAARVERRARRPREKGGLPNLVLVRASADMLPTELDASVDELRVDLPWGSLLETILASDDSPVVRRLAELLAPGGALRIVVNPRALPDGLSPIAAEARLRRAVESAGLSDVDVRSTAITPETGWGKRLAGGRPLPVIVAEARRLSPSSLAASP
jgi:SAM-dependent methyltransferase